MQYDTITPLLNRFNNMVDSLIKDFKEYNLDGETIIFLAKKTKNFINFTDLALLNVIFAIFEKIDIARYNFDEEILEAKQIIGKIFEDMNESLNTILEHDHDEEEHDHGHDHDHEHHQIDVDEIQKDLKVIVDDLAILKKLLDGICDMLIVTLKYQAEEIKEEVFKKEYDNFKDNMAQFNDEFESNSK